MKNRILISPTGLMSLLFLALMVISCTKESSKNTPTVVTASVKNLSTTTVTVGGNVTDAGNSAVTTRGICINTYGKPTLNDLHAAMGQGTGAFTVNLLNMLPGETYYVRAYATNSYGTSYGGDVRFTMLELSLVETTYPENVTTNMATSGGTISEYVPSPVIARGVCWSSFGVPTIDGHKTTDGSGTGSFTSHLTDLTPGTDYYISAYAITQDQDILYGNIYTFRTFEGSVTDACGNLYYYNNYGQSAWLTSNLRTTRYADSSLIPEVTNSSNWGSATLGAYCNYGNDDSLGNLYGKLYNFFAVTNSRNLCPAGWHVPTDAEWQLLINYLGGDSVAGGKMKEDGTLHWASPNYGATNESGFTALPGGIRDGYGIFWDEKAHADFWSSTIFSGNQVWWRTLSCNNAAITQGNGVEKWFGLSVRCVKN